MIERSGLYVDTSRQPFLITQGITGGIMVAGKQTLFRIYIDPEIVFLVDNIGIRVRGPIGRGGERDRHFFVSKNYLVAEHTFPHGPSVEVILLGNSFPISGEYELSFWVHESGGNRFFFNLNTGRIRFYPTKDLRLLVVYLDLSYLNPLNAPRPGWYYDIFRAMERLGGLYPVRDGVQSSLNGNRVAGIRYQHGTPYVASPNADMYGDIYGQTRQINSSPGDDVDVTVEYRRGFFVPEYLPREADPRPGGNAGRPPDARFRDLRRANVVGGRWTRPANWLDSLPEEIVESTGSLLAQELGHNLGLEPSGSPHSDGGGHSKDLYVLDPLAYDFINMKPYIRDTASTYPGDYMGNAWMRGENEVITNAYDWDVLRSSLMNLPSTGTDTVGAPPVARAIKVSTNRNNYEKFLTKIDSVNQWDWTDDGAVVLNKTTGGEKISEKIHQTFSLLSNAGIRSIEMPIATRNFDPVKRIRNINATTKQLDCFAEK